MSRNLLRSFMSDESNPFKYLEEFDLSKVVLPKSFNWCESPDGKNYCPIVKKQSCGSCYTQGVVSSLESRMKIKHKCGKDQELVIDAEQVYMSNYYSEGCSGGFDMLVNKFGSLEGFKPLSETSDQCLHKGKKVDEKFRYW
jgi:hypothetical protein